MQATSTPSSGSRVSSTPQSMSVSSGGSISPVQTAERKSEEDVGAEEEMAEGRDVTVKFSFKDLKSI